MVIVLDCNIWISLTLNSKLDFIADLSDAGIKIASCTELRSEIVNVLSRRKFSKFVSSSDIENVRRFHDLVSTIYTLSKIVNVTTDHKDDYLFALAVKAKADYIVTGDKLLLSVVSYKKTQVVTLAQFRQFNLQ